MHGLRHAGQPPSRRARLHRYSPKDSSGRCPWLADRHTPQSYAPDADTSAALANTTCAQQCRPRLWAFHMRSTSQTLRSPHMEPILKQQRKQFLVPQLPWSLRHRPHTGHCCTKQHRVGRDGQVPTKWMAATCHCKDHTKKSTLRPYAALPR